MNDIKDGGPAFPLSHSHIELEGTNWQHANGMVLRDYFAAKAMQGIVSGSMAAGAEVHNGDPEQIARVAYLLADSMLCARKV